MTFTVNNVTYHAVPVPETDDDDCTGCAAYDHPRLCAVLRTQEPWCTRTGVIWVLAPEKQLTTAPKPDPVTAALKSYDQLATAMQAAGGDIQALGDMTLFEFLVAAAKNNISITAKYSR